MTLLSYTAAAAIIAVSATVSLSVAAQQAMSADEKEIRDLIAAEDNGKGAPQTEDRIFWSGAYKQPTVGRQPAQEIPGDGQISNRVPGSQRSRTTVRRIEIAKSGDLAYEFNDAQLSYELKGGEKASFPRSALRVWRKEAGQWKVAAHFSHPHYQDPAPAKK